MNNDVISLFPVCRGGDLVLVSQLERVHDTQNLVKVSPARRGVGDDESNDILGINDKN